MFKSVTTTNNKNLFGDDFVSDLLAGFFTNQTTGGRHVPVDVKANDKEYILLAEMPGLEKDNISVDLDGETLTIIGKARTRKEEAGESWHIRECLCGETRRSFRLPGISGDGITASYKDGVLKVVVPKGTKGKNAIKVE